MFITRCLSYTGQTVTKKSASCHFGSFGYDVNSLKNQALIDYVWVKKNSIAAPLNKNRTWINMNANWMLG